MQKLLAESLVHKKILHPDLEVQAAYKAASLAGQEKVTVTGTFVIKEIEKQDDNIYFILASTVDGKKIKVSPRSIISIDGMEPDRYARVFNINADGSIKERGKKRGRKTKKDRMYSGLAHVGYKVPSTYEFPDELIEVILWEIFPENANDDPSSIPDGNDVLSVLRQWNVPTVELTDLEKEHGEENFWAWD